MTLTPQLKFERRRSTHRTGLSIWEVPEVGLYRVVETNGGEFTVETLTQNGWTHLIQLDANDRVLDSRAAFDTWIQIQTPSAPDATDEQF